MSGFGNSDPSARADIRRHVDRLQADIDELDGPVSLAHRALDWIGESIDLTTTTVWLMLAGYTYDDNFYVRLTAQTRAAYDDLVARVPWGTADVLDQYPIPEAGVLKRTGPALGGRVIVTYVAKDGEQ